MLTKTAARCGALILLAAPLAQADTTLTYQSQPSGSNTVMIRDGMVRMVTPQPQGGGKTVSIYDGQKNRFIVIDERQHRYMTMDKAKLAEQAKRMEQMRTQMMAQMREQMKDMPAEQRKMIEQQMARFAAGKNRPEPKVEVRKTGQTQTVNGFRCEMYQSFIDGKPAGEACIADPKQLGVPRADYQAMKNMFAFMADMAQTLSGNQSSGPQGFEEVPGLPVLTRDPNGGVMELKRVETRPLDPKLFQIPAGYTLAHPMQGNRPTAGSR